MKGARRLVLASLAMGVAAATLSCGKHASCSKSASFSWDASIGHPAPATAGMPPPVSETPLLDAVAGTPNGAIRRAAVAGPTHPSEFELDSTGALIELVDSRSLVPPNEIGALLDMVSNEVDVAHARDIAITTKSPPFHDAAWAHFQVQRGAWLCLLGDSAAGLHELDVAVDLARLSTPALEPGAAPYPPRVESSAEALLAQLACGGGPITSAFSEPALARRHFDVALLVAGGEAPLDEGGGALRPLATLATRQRTLTPSQAMDLFAPCRGPAMLGRDASWMFLSPDTIRFGDPTMGPLAPVLGSPEKLEALATSLETMAKKAPKSLACDGHASAEATIWRADVPRALRRLAMLSWALAGAECLRRGDEAGTERDARHADEALFDDSAPLTVSLHLGAHDVVRALASADRAGIVATSYDEHLFAAVVRALALEANGDIPGAREAAERAVTIAGQTDGLKRPPWKKEYLELLIWLRAALTTRAHDLGPVTPSDIERATTNLWKSTDPTERARAWLTMESASAPDQRTARMRWASSSAAGRDPLVLAHGVPWAALEVYQAAVAGDVEVWLDAAAPSRSGGRAYCAARAKAARARGDIAAAAVWEERLARAAALVHDDRTAWLAVAAGL